MTPTTPSSAVEAMLAAIVPGSAVEVVPVESCVGRILAEPLVTDRDNPAADVSAMDGYAIGPECLRDGAIAVSATGRIGVAPPALSAGSAVRVVTGGGVPEGAWAVVRREDVREMGERIELFERARATITRGQHIRRRGENALAGTIAAPAGRVITAALAGALATFGVSQVSVRRRVRVGILLTGDELLDAGAVATAYQVRDSSGVVLRSLLATRPWLQVESVQRSGDDLEPTLLALAGLVARCDAVVVTGGVSMGDRDHVPAAIAKVGGRTLFHKLPQRPGRPILGAVLKDGRPVFGLPGNPLSTLVTARRFVLAVLAGCAGVVEGGECSVPVVLAQPSERALDLWWFRLFRVVGPGVVELLDPTGSGDVPASARSDGFVEIPPGGTGAGPWQAYFW